MTGVDAVTPEDFWSEYNLTSLLRGSVMVEQTTEGEKPLHKRLLEAALNCIRQAEIHFPHATLEISEHEAVLTGIPHGSQLLVCAAGNDGRIHNYL